MLPDPPVITQTLSCNMANGSLLKQRVHGNIPTAAQKL